MRLKRFIAEDTRTALRLVRAEQGADAVILSNRSTPGGIEIIAATDFDESVFDALRTRPAVAAEHTESEQTSREPGACGTTPEGDERVAGLPDDALANIHTDIDALKALLEGQLTRLTWDAERRRNPHFARHLKKLTEVGFAPGVARQLATALAGSATRTDEDAQLRRLLQQRITFRDAGLLSQGGVAALVGPTGVGKTTTIAKLAARAAMIHGPSRIALISADANRIGARDQLGRFAALLGIEMFEANGSAEIDRLLRELSDKLLVLIDTSGLGQTDPRLTDMLNDLRAVDTPLRILLTIAANSQFRCIDWTIHCYAGAGIDGLVLTKIDETSHVAPALGALLQHQLGLDFVTDGQAIPEDLHAASTSRNWLIERCLCPLQSMASGIDDDYLAQTFAGEYHVCI